MKDLVTLIALNRRFKNAKPRSSNPYKGVKFRGLLEGVVWYYSGITL